MADTRWFAMLVSAVLLLTSLMGATPQDRLPGTPGEIDREALVTRHNVHVTTVDTLASLSVGNGAFAFTVDATGLQTFPEMYEHGVPLGTQSDWGWDRYPNTENYRFEETLRAYEQYGRSISYSVQRDDSERSEGAVRYYRSNPHRLQLGNVGLELFREDGGRVRPEDLQHIDQTLNLWTGEVESRFHVEGTPVTVWTAAHQEEDAVGVRIESNLIRDGRLKIRLRFPYPTGGWTDVGTKWTGEHDYPSVISSRDPQGAVVTRQMDAITYHVGLRWQGRAAISKKEQDYFAVEPAGGSRFSFTAEFSEEAVGEVPTPASVAQSSTRGWKAFWESGGAVDFSRSTDPRAAELERRVVLSQYLTKLQCTGEMPPQETGLTYNSWYGKPHLEMHWWHGVHFALWGRPQLLRKSLPWYGEVFDEARAIAQRQGFDGVRWQKMTGPQGGEGPSSVGSFLIWQQPHFITYAELMYRADSTRETLEAYRERVFATADFMASFAHHDSDTGHYRLGPGLIPAQERFDPMQTYNPTYELAYWSWALNTAIAWKSRLDEEVPARWRDVAENLSPLPVRDGVYLATASAADSYTRAEFMTDHPSVLGAFGMVPATVLLDEDVMRETFDLVWERWAWQDTWGWDFPMTAMTAARLGMPEKAVAALFKDVQTNTYLKNGHNYQEERLTLYLPGNGGLLAAVAMMCAGWEGSEGRTPGFPEEGWDVRWEGLQKMP